MTGNDYKLLIAMDDELKDTLHCFASQSGKTLSAFIRESVKEHIENLANHEKGEDKSSRLQGCLARTYHRLCDLWLRMKRSVLCRVFLNLVMIGLCLYIYRVFVSAT
jgi:predicted DNA-binding protein